MKRLFGGASAKRDYWQYGEAFQPIFAKIADVKQWRTLDLCHINIWEIKSGRVVQSYDLN